MASPADIIIVKDNLPPEAFANGWDDEKIELLLDSGLTTSRTVRHWWVSRASATAAFVSVSESGSSRDLSAIHKQALEMLKYWDGIIAEEEAPEEPVVVVSDGRIAFHRIRRV